MKLISVAWPDDFALVAISLFGAIVCCSSKTDVFEQAASKVQAAKARMLIGFMCWVFEVINEAKSPVIVCSKFQATTLLNDLK